MELFLFDKKDRVFIHPEALRLTQYLKKLSKDQAAYVILAYDYHSKIHMFPVEDRKRRAKREIFPGMGMLDIEEGNELLKNAIEEYNDLQYDPLRETQRAYISKIAQLQEQMRNEESMNAIRDIDKTIAILEKRVGVLDDKLFKSEQEEIKLKGNKRPSLVENWQRNLVARKKEREENRQNEGLEIIS